MWLFCCRNIQTMIKLSRQILVCVIQTLKGKINLFIIKGLHKLCMSYARSFAYIWTQLKLCVCIVCVLDFFGFSVYVLGNTHDSVYVHALCNAFVCALGYIFSFVCFQCILHNKNTAFVNFKLLHFLCILVSTYVKIFTHLFVQR